MTKSLEYFILRNSNEVLNVLLIYNIYNINI